VFPETISDEKANLIIVGVVADTWKFSISSWDLILVLPRVRCFARAISRAYSRDQEVDRRGLSVRRIP
jgi:hypothetical protein